MQNQVTKKIVNKSTSRLMVGGPILLVDVCKILGGSNNVLW